MNSRFMFLISDCNFIAGRQHSHVFANVLTKRLKEVFNQTDDREPCQTGLQTHCVPLLGVTKMCLGGLVDLPWDTSRTKNIL